MKTIEQIEDRSLAIAFSHFHCEDGQPWEPFENYSKEDLAEEVAVLTDVIAHAMRWAQES